MRITDTEYEAIEEDRRVAALARLAGRFCPDCLREYGQHVPVLFDGRHLICEDGEGCYRGYWGPRVRHRWRDPAHARKELILSPHER